MGRTLRGIARRAANAVSPSWWAGKAAARVEKRDAANVLSMLRLIRDGGHVDTATWQVERLSAILKHAYAHCPYYTDLFDAVGFDPDRVGDLQKIPLLDKDTARHRTPDLTADNIGRMRHHVKRTGGSISEPLRFPLSELACEMDAVHYQFAYECMGYLPGDRILAFSGPELPAELVARNVFWLESPNKQDLPYGRLYYSAFWVNEDTLPMLTQHMLHNQPAILRGYPSLINEFMSYMIENAVEAPSTVKGIQFTSENVLPMHIEKAQATFHTQVFLQYGHSEMGVFAYTVDDTYVYRCSPFFGITEVLNEDGTHVAKGEIGEVVVTGLHNFAFPFIRYRTGDMATYSGNDNGFVLLERMEGRIHDYFHGADGRRVSIMMIPELDAFLRIGRWQAIQDVPGTAVLKVVKEPEYTDHDEKELIDYFRTQCKIDVQIEYVDSIPLTQRGKLRQLVQNIGTSPAREERPEQ